MAKHDRKIIFRRIRGRIVPIRVKRDARVGVGLIAGGLVTAAAGGKLQRQAIKVSKKASLASFRAGGLAARALGVKGRKRRARTLARTAKAAARSSKVAGRVAFRARSLQGLGAVLIGLGIERSTKRFVNEKDVRQDLAQDLFAAAGGGLATVAFGGKLKAAKRLFKIKNLIRKRK